MARVTISGIREFQLRTTRRMNFLKEAGIRDLLKDVGAEFVDSYRAKIASFTPGDAKDLTVGYKLEKRTRFGRIYPILIASGVLVASIYSRVYRGPPWEVRIGFAGSRPGGMKNADLADFHAKSGRDFTVRPAGWSRKWLKEIGERLRRER